ncbi:MAG: hypothetical protein R2713_18780 [Ilumatobacteraceae bacterium]
MSITVVRRTVRVIAATVVLASLVSAWVGGAERTQCCAAVCLPLAVLAILLPSQLLSQTMQRSLAFSRHRRRDGHRDVRERVRADSPPT